MITLTAALLSSLYQTSAGLTIIPLVALGVIVILVIGMAVDRGFRGCCCLLFGSCIKSVFLKMK